jgi:hypothetical protein
MYKEALIVSSFPVDVINEFQFLGKAQNVCLHAFPRDKT